MVVTSDSKIVRNWINNQLLCGGDTSNLSIPVGFDIEWKSVFSKAGTQNLASIVQLSTPRSCLIVQINHLVYHDRTIAEEMKNVLQSDDIIKVGVGVREDLDRLKTDYNISYGAYVDIGKITSSKLGLKSTSLESLSTHYFNINAVTWKSREIQLSNWENVNLTHLQISYAAYDSLAAIEVYYKMQELGLIDFESDNLEWLYSSMKPLVYVYDTNNYVENSLQSDNTETDSSLLPLSKRSIQKLINRATDESSYKHDVLLKKLLF